MSKRVASRATSPADEQVTIWVLTGALFILELCGVLVIFALYKKDQAPWVQITSSTWGSALVIGAVGMSASIAAIAGMFWRGGRGATKQQYFTVLMNVITVALIGAGGEVIVRAVKTHTRDGREFVKNRLLLPRNWAQTKAHFQEVFEKATGDLTYLTYDADLGWRVGDNRQSANGLYHSGQNGIRTRRVGETVERLQDKTVVALVGDSFTFGEEVPYDDTWGAHLQEMLGDEFQVINFGVPGYGIDQMYLRYARDVLPWNPDIVVYAFISNDLVRSTSIYTFLGFPDWDLPYSKPRFIATSAGLELMNIPTLRPESIFSASRVEELPSIAHDVGYRSIEWAYEWEHASDLVRFIQARFPRWNRINEGPSEDAIVELNSKIARAFLAKARQAGGVPLLAYLPSSEDFWPKRDRPTLGRIFLEALSEPYLDPMPCLREVPADSRFVAGNGHYSASGNKAVAECFVKYIKPLRKPS